MSKILIGRSDTDLDYPICRPSLDLDFTQEVLDPRITFTRGSIGTRVNRNRLIETISANQPRFDYDPITGECKGLLIEESRSNVLRYSEDFTQTGVSNWDGGANGASRIGNIIAAPDGNTTADKLVEGTSKQSGYSFYQPNTISGTGDLCFSVFAKAAERRYIELNIWDGNTIAAGAAFDLQTGTYLASGQTGGGSISVVSYGIIPYPNGWYRCYFVANRSSITYIYSRIVFARSYPYVSYQGDGISGLYVWGAQTEVGSFPTSYIPTTTATVTRSADLASITGTNFSSWFNQTEGTLYADLNNITTRSSLTFDRLVALTGSDVNRNVISITTQTAAGGGAQNGFIPGVSYSPDGSYVVDVSLSVVSGVGPLRIGKPILAYQRNNFGFTVSGAKPTFRGKGEVPICDRLLIFGQARYQPAPSGYIKRLTYYPRRLKDNQLQLLTQ